VPKNKLPIFAYLLLAASLCFNLLLSIKLHESNLFLVSRVSDGDTIVLNDNQVIRLANLNAPEYNACGGQESKDFLEKLILGKKVTIKALSYDEYHRTLAIVYLQGQNVNSLLISSGWADYDSNFKVDRELMSNATIGAKQNRAGIYSLCRSQTPPTADCKIKANNHNGTKIYFLPSCSNYSNTSVEKDKGDQWFCNESEAIKAGYKKSGDCR
jgi:endonuclease YncB( thermonuclease family)